jgi:hypothetical protein
MAGENTVSTLNGLFKTVYADKLEDLVPDFAILQKRVDFVPGDKQVGAFYAQPVNLSQEAGFSYLGTAGGVSALSAIANGVMKEAQVTPSELNLRAQMSYAALARAATQGERAFRKASAWKIEDMNNSMRKRLEIAMLYGQSGIGTVESINDLGGGSGEIVITAATWAGGIWAGAEGARLDSFTSTTKNNSTAALQITAVDSDSRKLTVSYSGTFSRPATSSSSPEATRVRASSTRWPVSRRLSPTLVRFSTFLRRPTHSGRVTRFPALGRSRTRSYRMPCPRPSTRA